MKRSAACVVVGLVALGCSSPVPAEQAAVSHETARIALKSDWTLQSAAVITEKGDVLSRPGLETGRWHRVTVPNTVVGAFRRYRFDVTPHVRVPGINALAVEVTAPEPGDLAFMWVD